VHGAAIKIILFKHSARFHLMPKLSMSGVLPALSIRLHDLHMCMCQSASQALLPEFFVRTKKKKFRKKIVQLKEPCDQLRFLQGFSVFRIINPLAPELLFFF
jgi:hypothetical protein